MDLHFSTEYKDTWHLKRNRSRKDGKQVSTYTYVTSMAGPGERASWSTAEGVGSVGVGKYL